MILLLLDPPRFECETAGEAATLARLMGITAVPAPPVIVRSPIAPDTAKAPARPTAGQILHAATPKPVSRFAGRGPMEPTGKTKSCKTCGKPFPILDHSDCPSVYCRGCRPVVAPRKNPKPPIPAAGRLTVKKHADPVSCSTCGASVPEFEAINGQCLQCAPLAARKRA